MDLNAESKGEKSENGVPQSSDNEQLDNACVQQDKSNEEFVDARTMIGLPELTNKLANEEDASLCKISFPVKIDMYANAHSVDPIHTIRHPTTPKYFYIKSGNCELTEISDKPTQKDPFVKQHKEELAKVFAPLPRTEGNLLRIRQPFKILTDIWGVLTSYNFRKDLFDYIDLNLKSYILKYYDSDDIKTYIDDIVKRTNVDKIKYPDIPIVNLEDNNKEDIVNSVVENIDFRRKNKDKALMQYLDNIFNQIWNEGFISYLDKQI